MNVLTAKEARQMIIDPVKSLLRSRRFILLITTLFSQLLMGQFPDAAPLIQSGMDFFGMGAIALILGISVQDAAAVYGSYQQPTNTRETIIEIVDEILNERESAE